MVKFYAEKIRSAAINPNTKEVWMTADVPKLWRAKVEKELEG